MSTFTVKFDCDNAAFGENDSDRAIEIARILRDIAARVERGDGFGWWETVRDLNGNDVGRFALKDYDGQGGGEAQ